MHGRGQSSPVSVILIFALVIGVAGGIAVMGGSLLMDLQEQTQAQTAEQDMSQFSSTAASVALGQTDRQTVHVDSGEAELRVNGSTSWMRVEIGGPDNRSLIHETDLGTVTYDTGNAIIAYENGGVWRLEDDGSTMVSPPEFHYRGNTLTLPMISVDGSVNTGGSGGTDVRVVHNETTRIDHGGNPLDEDDGRVYVTIHSEFYEAWGSFLTDRTEGMVTEIDHETRTVTVELIVPGPSEIQHAAFGASQQSDAIQVNSGACVDSYDSTQGTYNATTHSEMSCEVDREDATIATHGGMDPVDAEVAGDLYTVRNGGHIGIDDDANITGEIHSQQSLSIDDDAYVGDTVYADQSVTLLDGGTIHGAVHSDGTVDVQGDGTVEGAAYSNHRVLLDDSGRIEGDVHADEDVTLQDDSVVTGTVRTESYIDLGDGVTIQGDAYAEHNNPIRCGDDAEIEGDVYVPDPNKVDGGCVGGSVYAQSDADPEDPTPPDEPVIDPPQIENPADNATSSVPGECLDGASTLKVEDGETCTLPGGIYDVTKVDVQDGGTLELDYSGSGIEVYTDELVVNEGGEIVTTPDRHQAPQVEFNVRAQGSVDVQDNVTGVINAPDADVELGDGANLYGAVVADSAKVNDGAGLHYDEALAEKRVGTGNKSVARIKFLHVTENEIEIES